MCERRITLFSVFRLSASGCKVCLFPIVSIEVHCILSQRTSCTFTVLVSSGAGRGGGAEEGGMGGERVERERSAKKIFFKRKVLTQSLNG